MVIEKQELREINNTKAILGNLISEILKGKNCTTLLSNTTSKYK